MSKFGANSLLFGAVLVASCVAVGVLLNEQGVASLSTQPVPQVQTRAVPELVLPKKHQSSAAPETVQPPEASVFPMVNSENLEEIGAVVTSLTKATLPLVAAFFAVVAGFFLHRVATNDQRTEGLTPMDMAADEVTPLTRRGALTALATLPLAAAATPAWAARSGGRIGGGSGFRSFSSRAPSPPPVVGGAGGGFGGVSRGGAVFVTPAPPVIVGPPVMASPFGFGFGPVVSYGFSTGELLALSALELGEAFVREQRRQEFLRQQLETQRKLGQDEAQIQALQQQLAMQDKRMQELQEAMRTKGVPAPAQ